VALIRHKVFIRLENIMIQVNQATINEQAILAEMQYHPAETQRSAMIKAAESLIISELLRQRAAALGLEVKSDDDAASDADYLAALFAQEVAVPQATDAECEQYFKTNAQRFTQSPLLEVQHILIAAETDNELARISAQQDAEALLIKLQLGQDFAQLAQQYSACPSKHEAGDLGVISRGQTVPEFERQLLLLPVGLHHQPLESRYGFHIVKINRITPGQALVYADVKEKIAAYLHERVRHKAIAQYIYTLIGAAKIEGYDFSVPSSPLMQ
jgi:peptidyl-prolyl cis-trans isomerase C